MTVKVEDLVDFVIKLNKKKIRTPDLKFSIAEKWGCTEYTIKSRIRIMLDFGFIRHSTTGPNIFDVCIGGKRHVFE